MKICFLRRSRLLQIATLVAVTIGMGVGVWVLDTMTARAAPPTPGPIGIQGIIHQCTDPNNPLLQADPSLKEDPLNDTYDWAVLLKGGQVQTHTLDSGGLSGTHDKDWFEFTVPAGQVFTLSTTFPGGSILTTTQISLFTSTTTAYSDDPAAIDTDQLGWEAPVSPITQTFWARVRNPFSASQDPTNDFCDVVYNLELRLLGSLAHSGTVKTAEAGPGRTLTYTLILSNTGELLSPVLVTDTLPDGVYMTSFAYPSSVTTDYLTTTTNLSWTGWVSGYSSVQFTINATATKVVTDVTNTAWITVTEGFTVTSNNVTFGPEGVFLPIILKNSS